MTEYIEQDDDSMDLCGAIEPGGDHFCILVPEHGGTIHCGMRGSVWKKDEQ
jgi:hypothetical protein